MNSRYDGSLEWIEWERVAEAYRVVDSNQATRADVKMLNGTIAKVYSMGKDNPVIRIDIKRQKSED